LQLQRPVLRQEQKLKLTPQLFQAIKLMSLPIQDLRLKIQEELINNPALEVVEDNSEVSLDDMQGGDGEDYSVFEEASDPGYTRRKGQEASDAKRQFMEGALTRPESLQEHLLWQLRLQPIGEELFTVGELLIRNLDENGFHREPPEALLDAEQQRLLAEALGLIRGFDPPGTATADYRESLLVQLQLVEDPHPRAFEAVEKHMDLLEKKKHELAARKMKITEAELQEILDSLKNLDPIPGRNFATEPPRYVIPDVMVRMRDGDFYIVLNDEEIPVLGINPFFNEIEKSDSKKKELNRFVHSRVNDARWFIRSIGQRNATLLKTCRVIVEFQRDFFRLGPKYLRPLTLKDIASEIGVHEATVSRITNGKYIQTEWGIFELKYFFSNAITGPGSTGSRYSKQSVKEIIREIIEGEGSHQLTDKRIMEILSERGINIARRTVSKYRNELNIESSFQR